MTYALGIDVGTTYTAAAVWRDDRVEVVALEAHRVAVPTVIAAEGAELRFGSAATSRGISNPDAAAREFKRRLGDAMPMFLSGAPYSVDRLVALFARWVYDTVSAQIGEPPVSVTVTHPANWTEFQHHLLATSLEQAGIRAAKLMPEPEAAAIDFGSIAELAPGDLVLVYDLGGGTFDVAILRRTADGFSNVGVPCGVERLGGIDFDEALFAHVLGQMPPDVIEQAQNDPTGRLGLAQLRARCVEAKETLSSDVSVDVPVLLPRRSSTVRVTRHELEGMVRPMLLQTIELARQALDQAGLTPDQLSAVLLVGGSSRIPLVSELVQSALGVPVRVDAHPKLVVARGAARRAAADLRRAPLPPPAPVPAPRRRTAPIAMAIGGAALVVAAVFVGLRITTDDSGAAPASTTFAPASSAAATTVVATVTATTPLATPPVAKTVVTSSSAATTVTDPASSAAPSTESPAESFKVEEMTDAGVAIAIPTSWMTVTPSALDDPGTLATAAERAGVPAAQFRSILDIGETGSPAAAKLVVAVSDDGTLSKLRVQSTAQQAGGLPTPDEFAQEIERAAGPLFDTGNLRDLRFVRDGARAITTGNGNEAIDVRYHAEPDPGSSAPRFFGAVILVDGDDELLTVQVTSPDPTTATSVADTAIATVQQL